jgi:hypothetical protein
LIAVRIREFAPEDAARWEAFVQTCGEATFALWRPAAVPVANAIGPQLVKNLG